MAVLLFVLPLLFASAHSQYVFSIPCQSAEQCAGVMGEPSNPKMYLCNEGFCFCANLTTRTFEMCTNHDMMLTATVPSGLRRNCTEHEDCSAVQGANCLPKDPKDKSSKICLCRLDRVESEDGQRCLPVVTKIGGPCIERMQCIKSLEDGSDCVNGQCLCATTHHFGKNDKCVRNLGYGDQCKTDEDGCYLTSTPQRDNLLTCTENYGCRCKNHWTYNQNNQQCEFSSASQVAIQFVTMVALTLMLTAF